MVAALLAVSPAYADPAQPKAKPARRAWKAKRAEPVKPPASPVVITPAVFNAAPTTDVRKFAATIESKPSPGLIYHAAQVYRMNGERAKAIELYQKYLDVAPRGPAANACKAELEKLHDVPQ